MRRPALDITHAELLARLARDSAGREALVHPRRGVRWTFSDLDRRSGDLARGLVALGVEPGERVAVWAENLPDWVALQFAAARAGAVLVTANTALARPEVAYLLRQSRTAVVLVAPGDRGERRLDVLTELRSELPDLREVVALDGPAPAGVRSMEDLVAAGRSVAIAEVRSRAEATGPDDAANIQYTSGTTGFPKGVVLSHRNVIWNGWAQSEVIGVGREDAVLVQVPLFHCFGCVIAVLGAFTHDARIVMLDRFDPLHALEAIDAEGCTVIHGVPTMFRALLDHPDGPRFRTRSLRTGLMAGAPCPVPLMERVVADLGARGVVAAYGLTEAAPAVASSRPDDPVEQRCSTIGRPMPEVDVRIVDPSTLEDVEPGAPGELWCRSPGVMLGYFADPEASATAVTPDGWLRTGDQATRDALGLLRITGRIKELIIRGGENIAPAEVDDALRAHPAVRDAAAFGIPSERLGEKVAAAVVLREGHRITLEEITAFLEGRLARFKHPVRIGFLETLPLTGSGKVQRFKLAEALGWIPGPPG